MQVRPEEYGAVPGPVEFEYPNGHKVVETRVRFGPGETQTMPLDWAEHILTDMLHDERSGRKPRPFSVLLSAAAMAER